MNCFQNKAAAKAVVILEGAVESVRDKQQLIIKTFNKLTAEDRKKVFSYLHEQYGFELCSIHEGKSVWIYFQCQSLLELDRLKFSFTNGQLQTITEELFNNLLLSLKVQIHIKYMCITNDYDCQQLLEMEHNELQIYGGLKFCFHHNSVVLIA